MALAVIEGTIATAVVGGILIGVTVVILRDMWKKKKQGRSCCGCSCGCSRECSYGPDGRERDEKPEN